MKKYKIQLFMVAALSILLTVSLYGQTESALRDIGNVNELLAKHRYESEIQYNLYDTYDSRIPIETQLLSVRMWDLMTNIKSEHFHVIRNKENYLYVNFDSKLIMVNSVKSYGQELKQLKELEQTLDFDTILKSYTRIESLKTGAGHTAYRLFMPENHSISFYDINIDTAANKIQRVVIYYAKELDVLYGNKPSGKKGAKLPKLEIRFSNFHYSTTPEQERFDLSPYVVKKNKKQYTPGAAYGNFRFINNTF